MKPYISLIEIPVLKIDRAISFFEKGLNITIEKIDLLGMKMRIFPYEDRVL